MTSAEISIEFGKANNKCWRLQSSLYMWLYVYYEDFWMNTDGLKVLIKKIWYFLLKLIMFSDSCLWDQEKRLSRCNKIYWKSDFYAIQSFFQEENNLSKFFHNYNMKNLKVNAKTICLLSIEAILISAFLCYQLTLTYTLTGKMLIMLIKSAVSHETLIWLWISSTHK